MTDKLARSARPLGRKLVRWIGRGALAAAALGILSASFGAIYEIVGGWRDARRFPQHGRFFQAGPVKLNLNCSGQGSPTIILDSGSGIPAIGWIKVQPEVSRFARVCSYDRAGYGWSELGPKPRTSLQIARELKMLLDAAGEKRPYVLVGHSFGAFNVRVFTGQYPKDVTGVVLLDGSHEDEEERILSTLTPAAKERAIKEMERQEKLDQMLTPLRIHLGIRRFEVALGWHIPPYLSKDLQQEPLYLNQQIKAKEASNAESTAFAQSVSQVRAAGNFGDRPLIVLTAGKPYEGEPFLGNEQRELWIHVLQVEEMHLSMRGKQIVVPDSGHLIPYERPGVVVSAIHEVWSAARTTFP